MKWLSHTVQEKRPLKINRIALRVIFCINFCCRWPPVVQVALNTEYNYSACVFRRKKNPTIHTKKNLLQQGCLPLQLYTMGGHYPRTDLICCENCRINLRQWGNVEEMSKKDCHHARVLATGYTGGQWNFSNQYSGIAIAMGFVLYRRRVKSHFVILTSYCACVDWYDAFARYTLGGIAWYRWSLGGLQCFFTWKQGS